MNNLDYYRILFNLDCSQVVYRGRDKFETRSYPVALNAGQYGIIPNLELINASSAEYISINGGIPGTTRCDSNINCLRNFLIEFDSISLDAQRAIIIEKSIPWSTQVFSGSKSIHIIISLTEPVDNINEYKSYFKRICAALDNLNDKATGNPSRFTRAPNGIREKDGELIVQTLLGVRRRIEKSELEGWLCANGAPHGIVQKEYKKRIDTTSFKIFKLKATSQLFIKRGAPQGEWNLELYKAALDIAECNGSLDEAIGLLSTITGSLDKKDMSTVYSAYRHTQGREINA